MLQLRTLGTLDLRRDDGTELLSVVSQPKRIGLLCYLAFARPGSFHRRDTLLPLFWPEADDQHARASLRQAVHYLRRSLGEQVVLSRGDEEVGLAAGEIWCDAVAFEEALDTGEAERALGLYHGELLPGLYVGGAPEFERWLEAERTRLRDRAVRGARALAEARERAGDAAAAAQWARRALSLAPTDERLLRACMELLDRLGIASAAGEAYEGYAQLLHDEYDVEPSPELKIVAREIRARAQTSPSHAEVAAPAGSATRRTGGGAPGSPASSSPPPAVGAPGVPLLSAWPAAPPGRGRVWPPRRYVLVGLAGILVAIAVGGSTIRYRRAHGPPATGAETASIAVLPFVDLSPGRDQGYLADGITSELIELLGQMPGLRVPGPTSSFYFKGKSLPLKDIARQLGVTNVLEGEVLKTGRHVRVTVRFASAAGDRQLWSQTYETAAGDVSDIQHQIARYLVSRLRLAAADFPRRAPRNPEAYDLYLQGLFAARAPVNTQTGSVQDERAIELFRSALALEPGFASAWAALARSSYQAGDFAAAEQAARRALDLDSTLPMARMALAGSLGYGRWQWADAERELERAIRLSPSVAVLYVARANLRFVLGRQAEALLDYARAEALDPLGGHYAGHANQLVRAGRWQEMLQVMEYIPGADPRSRILPYTALGRHQEALALALATGDSTSVAVLSGNHQQVMALVQRRDAKENYCAAGWILRLHWFDQRAALQRPRSDRVPATPAQLQDTRREFGDQQYHCLERKVRRHDQWVGFYVRAAVTGDSLGSQPRFQRLLQEIGLRD